MIHYLCLQFYFHGEYFAKSDNNSEISNDKMIAKELSKCNDFYAAIYGKLSIDSMSNSIATWTFKLLQLHNERDGSGIRIFLLTDELRSGKSTHFYFYNNGKSYGNPLSPFRYSLFHKPPKFETGDIIKLTLDTKDALIKLQKNNDEEVTIFKDIQREINIKYKIGIRLLEKNNAIEIIDFDCNQKI